jgi:hypothetical protein
MPLKRCQDDDKPGWKWGDAGKCYVYTAGDEASETAARKKALAQASAMGEFPGTGQNRSSVGVGEVEHRSSTLQDVNTRQRIVEIIAVPYDEEADVMWRGDIWHESFDRKAFEGIESHVGRVQVNREHVKGDTVGKVIAADPGHKDGLFARVKIFNTPRGDETLTLAEEGGAFPSIGWRLNRPSDQLTERRSMSRRVLRAYWDHQAFVEDPAYVGAGVLAVRAGQSGLAVAEGPLPETPLLDEAMSDPMLAWAAQRLHR